MSKILLVDDDEILMDMLKNILEDSDDLILMASTGEQAMKLFQDTNPDLVIIDVIMPGMDGFELLKQFKERRQNFRSILLTGLNEDRGRKLARELGADSYLGKPPNIEILKSTIKHLLRMIVQRFINFEPGFEICR